MTWQLFSVLFVTIVPLGIVVGGIRESERGAQHAAQLEERRIERARDRRDEQRWLTRERRRQSQPRVSRPVRVRNRRPRPWEPVASEAPAGAAPSTPKGDEPDLYFGW